MSETRKTAVSVDDMVVLAEALGAEQEEQRQVLHALEARPIVDVSGIERRLEEVADAVERLQAPQRKRRARAWWVTPLFVTLAYVVGVLSTYGVLWVVQQQRLAHGKHPGIVAPVTPPVGKKGK
jgi:hypothetical protein